MQSLTIIGNLTRDPESRVTKSGKDVCSFTVAVNRRKKEDGADFFRVTAWDQKAVVCGKYLSKGSKVCVVGTVSVSTYTKENGEPGASLEVSAMDVEFLTTKGNGFVPVEDPDDPFAGGTR